jgi:hypothetical protein
MFAVYHKYSNGRLEWIGAAETESRAQLLARMWSRYGSTDVIVVRNRSSGDTEHLYTYRAGQASATPESAGAILKH